jgi:hypothetical protein
VAEWQRIRNQINAAFIFARADFVNVHFCADHKHLNTSDETAVSLS